MKYKQFDDCIDERVIGESGYSMHAHHKSLRHANAGGGDSGGGGTTTQTSEPWKEVKPYLKKGYERADNLYAQTPDFYPNSTVVPFSNETNAALDWQTNRAIQGSPVMAAGNREITSTLNGGYLNNNPYLDQMYGNAADDIQSRINSTFGGAGRTGSGIHAQVTARELGDLNNKMYGDQYSSERENMMRSMFAAPQIANQDYTDVAQLAAVGNARENIGAEYLQDDIARHDFEQNIPYSHLNNYMQLLNSAPGGSSTSSASGYQPQRSTFGSMLGGASTGFSMFGAPGAIGGGILGGLFG